MPLCGAPGCEAWGVYGDGRNHRCRQHVWVGFLPGPGYVPGVLAITSAAIAVAEPVKPQGSLL